MKRPNMDRGTECGDTAPARLTGDLGPVRCRLALDRDGRHSGDHRGRASIPHVGKAVFSWKQKKGTQIRHVAGPPVIDLREDAQQNPYLTGQMRKAPVCACPEWWRDQGQKMHHSPCTLV